MNDGVMEATSESARVLQTVVWPILRTRAFRVPPRLDPVETITAKGFTRELDSLAGIDAWLVRHDRGIQGMASRVQYNFRKANTFTIRWQLASGHETEWDKRLRYVDSHGAWLGPYLTCQAYVWTTPDGGYKFNRAAIAKTSAIIDVVKRGYYHEPNPKPGQNRFVAVYWNHVRQFHPDQIYICDAQPKTGAA